MDFQIAIIKLDSSVLVVMHLSIYCLRDLHRKLAQYCCLTQGRIYRGCMGASSNILLCTIARKIVEATVHVHAVASKAYMGNENMERSRVRRANLF